VVLLRVSSSSTVHLCVLTIYDIALHATMHIVVAHDSVLMMMCIDYYCYAVIADVNTGAIDVLGDPNWASQVGVPKTQVAKWTPRQYRFQTQPVFGTSDSLVMLFTTSTVNFFFLTQTQYTTNTVWCRIQTHMCCCTTATVTLQHSVP
jgi:hypothetical protein